MKDIFQEFKRASLKRHLTIGTAALAFAVGVNMFLFNTDVGVRMQASAIEATKGTPTQVAADISVIQNAAGTDRANIQLGKAIHAVKELEFTLFSDPSKILFGQIEVGTIPQADIVVTSSTGGIALVKLLFPAPVDLSPGTPVSVVNFTRSGNEPGVINIASVRAVTTEGTYELTSKGSEVR